MKTTMCLSLLAASVFSTSATAVEIFRADKDAITTGQSVSIEYSEWAPSQFFNGRANIYLVKPNGSRSKVASNLPQVGTYRSPTLTSIGEHKFEIEICAGGRCGSNGSLKVYVNPVCKLVTSGSSYYECGGKQVTQSFKTFMNPRSRITEFKVHRGFVTWKYYDHNGSSGTTARSYTSYHSNNINGTNRVQITQTADSNFNDADVIRSFQVKNNKAVWQFVDASRNCGIGCTSDVAYYQQCLDGRYPGLEAITSIAHSNLNVKENITDFYISSYGTYASWVFNRRNSVSSDSYPRNARLKSCG
ncbi:hypothetical protein [Pseudoalteromonas luteoviolacea]|uniref:DUF4360 domain-containing protein n=1 Tax=Pseudoalteromonas luteoviolacea S4060-1 TaxID=1365257 RepID=A0A162BFE7_9GAMM|nr:hypothetical protein [Pseudoalteromonas luteoviolacea]KZN30578.1 hypothetical protein N480_06360 [Pseudoalteromonas luteoviolacea S2607]KZN61257.1 hypothetical protein N478_04130 [Pseudoalteromonas luteoviolacea S4060-1]